METIKMTNEELLKIWSRDIVRQPFNKSELTRTSYRNQIEYFLEFVDNKSILDITKQDVKAYLSSKEISDSTYNSILASISSIYKVLAYANETEDLVQNNPTYNVMRVKVKNKEKVPFTKDEQRLLLQNCKNTRDYAIMKLLLSCGLRYHELSNLTYAQYINRDEDNGIKLVVTKRDKERMIYLSDSVIDAIEKYLPSRKEGCDKLFVSNGGKEMGRTCLSRTWKNIAMRAGFSEDRIAQVNNHIQRATMATTMGENGVPIQVIKETLGHSDLKSTMIYVKVSNDSVRKAMQEYCVG